jgi:hypothetical protein
MAVIARYRDLKWSSQKLGKQGGTAECPFVPEVMKGFFDLSSIFGIFRLT